MIVGGRFRIERRVACGAMGEVWAGVHCDLQLRVALKTLRREVASNQEIIARFSREALLLGRIQSDHVPRVIDFIADRRLGPVLVTEYIEGRSLASILDSRRLAVEEAIDLGIDIVTGLRELHRVHIVHRDVKPANILLRAGSGAGRCAVFVDFGVSRLAAEESGDASLTEITSSDRAVGTVEYVPPEQILSSRTVTASADLYAVGSILYRAVSGLRVFGDLQGIDLMKQKLSASAPPLATGRADPVAKGFQELVGRALASSPGERYETADEMLTELSLLRDVASRAAGPHAVADATAETVVSQPAPASTSTLEHGRERRHRSLARTTLAGLAGLVAGVAAGLFVSRFDFHPPATSSPTQLGLEPEHCSVSVETISEPPARSRFTIVCDEPAGGGN